MDIEFNSLNELYDKLLPVIRTKINEMRLRGVTYINESDIWNYQKNRWAKSHNLTFSDMVSDILNTDNEIYENFKKNNWKELN